MRMLKSILAYLIANAAGLLAAVFLLRGFVIDPLSFLVVVAVFSIALAVLGPVLTRLSQKRFPQIMSGIALVTIFAGLFVTDLIMPGMRIGGLINWLGATLLVWLFSLVASVVLPRYLGQTPAQRQSKG